MRNRDLIVRAKQIKLWINGFSALPIFVKSKEVCEKDADEDGVQRILHPAAENAVFERRVDPCTVKKNGLEAEGERGTFFTVQWAFLLAS